MHSDTSQIESEILEVFVKGRKTSSNSKSTNWLALSANKDPEPKSKDPLYIINQFNLFKRFILLNSFEVKSGNIKSNKYSTFASGKNILIKLPTVSESKDKKMLNIKLMLSIFKEEMERVEYYCRFNSNVNCIFMLQILLDLISSI